MKALVLEEKGRLSLREIDLPTSLGDDDVRIDMKAVGICGSDLHFYTHGRIGPYIVNSPMDQTSPRFLWEIGSAWSRGFQTGHQCNRARVSTISIRLFISGQPRPLTAVCALLWYIPPI